VVEHCRVLEDRREAAAIDGGDGEAGERIGGHCVHCQQGATDRDDDRAGGALVGVPGGHEPGAEDECRPEQQ
jgi:hypothetical protein